MYPTKVLQAPSCPPGPGLGLNWQAMLVIGLDSGQQLWGDRGARN